MRATRRKFTLAAASLLVFGPTGCASMSSKDGKQESSLMKRLPWVSDDEETPEPYPNPAKVATTWTPDSLVQSGRMPTRGFGGRIYFYDEKSRPVPVDGTLTIHGFDDTATSPEDSVKRFRFTPEQFTRHFSQTDLGASYSVWIPWDAVGGDQKKISLVASFTTVEGTTVQGTPATIVLPGHQDDPLEADPLAKFSPQYQQYVQAQNTLTTNPSGLTTTTIARRPVARPGSTGPGLGTPSLGKDASLAAKSKTRSMDLKTTYRPSRSSIQPASAQVPVQ